MFLSGNPVPEAKTIFGGSSCVTYINIKNLPLESKNKSPFLRPRSYPNGHRYRLSSHVNNTLLFSPRADRGRKHPTTAHDRSRLPQAGTIPSLAPLSRTHPDLPLGRLRKVLRRRRTALQPPVQRPHRQKEYQQPLPHLQMERLRRNLRETRSHHQPPPR